MKQEFAHLPYRPGVGIVLLNKDGLVWLGQRIMKWNGDGKDHLWQMPQGGIDKGETPSEAALRELHEETGTANAQIIAETADWLTYDLPDEALGIALQGQYRGQKQKWFAMRFLGQDSEIDISEKPGYMAEFSKWRWAPMRDAIDKAVYFRRPIYEELAREFSALVR